MSFLTHLDLFSGIGGFAIAAQACGFRTVAFCEIEPYAQQVLKEKFGAIMADAASERGGSENRDPLHKGRTTGESGGTCLQENAIRETCIAESNNRPASPLLHPDIFALHGADYLGVDLLTGGFPCQPYSLAGKRRGAADDRAIWPEMRRIVAEARPAWVLGENVPGIIGMELDRVLSDLETLGYACWPLVIPACAVDARHRRDRVWIVAYSNRSTPARQRQHGRQGLSFAEPKLACETGEVVANHEISGQSWRKRNQCSGRHELDGQRSHVADPKRDDNWGTNWTWRGNGKQEQVESYGLRKDGHWFPEPDVGRVAHGIPARSHRLRALGNAIVPQVAQVIIRNIANLESPPDP